MSPQMVLCVFVTVFLIASCWAKSTPEYRRACNAIVRQISKQKMNNVFDMMFPEDVAQYCSGSIFQVKNTSLNIWEEGFVYVSEKTCDGERLDGEDYHIIRFNMELLPYRVDGTIMVREEIGGEWIETTFSSYKFNGESWRVELLLDNKWNIFQLKYVNSNNYGPKRLFTTVVSGCPVKNSRDGFWCTDFSNTLNIRLTDIFEEKLRNAVGDVIVKVAQNTVFEVEDEKEI